VEDALKTRGIIYLNVETSLLFAPLSKFLATRLAVTHTLYKMHENQCVLLKCDIHVRPMRFTVMPTPTDSSDKIKNPIYVVYYIGVLVCTIV